jgi:hypothetical protein
MKDSIIEQIKNAFGSFDSDLSKIVTDITLSPEQFNSTIWDLVTRIFEFMLPIAYSLLALFFIIDFLNKSTRFDFMRWENVVKCLLKLIVAKFVVEKSFVLLNYIFTFVASLIKGAKGIGEIASVSGLDMAMMEKHVESLNFFQQIMFQVSTMPWTFVMNIIKVVVFLVIYGRMIELYILTAIAPLPLSTLSSEGQQGIARRFFQNYIAVCLQGLIIVVAVMIYGAMAKHININATDIWGALRNTVLTSSILLGILIKSSSWSKQICGM